MNPPPYGFETVLEKTGTDLDLSVFDQPRCGYHPLVSYCEQAARPFIQREEDLRIASPTSDTGKASWWLTTTANAALVNPLRQ